MLVKQRKTVLKTNVRCRDASEHGMPTVGVHITVFHFLNISFLQRSEVFIIQLDCLKILIGQLSSEQIEEGLLILADHGYIETDFSNLVVPTQEYLDKFYTKA